MALVRFEWDADKARANLDKHLVGFELAQEAFYDPCRIIVRDGAHSESEERFYCLGWVDGDVLTVRFTHRGQVIRIIGAGYWRKGRAAYEREKGTR
jgi:uncharacterized DUF497 family protein